jgi:hypothetical protein
MTLTTLAEPGGAAMIHDPVLWTCVVVILGVFALANLYYEALPSAKRRHELEAKLEEDALRAKYPEPTPTELDQIIDRIEEETMLESAEELRRIAAGRVLYEKAALNRND